MPSLGYWANTPCFPQLMQRNVRTYPCIFPVFIERPLSAWGQALLTAGELGCVSCVLLGLGRSGVCGRVGRKPRVTMERNERHWGIPLFLFSCGSCCVWRPLPAQDSKGGPGSGKAQKTYQEGLKDVQERKQTVASAWRASRR